MISLSINKLGKKFNREWIFRDLSLEIAANQKLVILGGNGSGKSTLLQVLSGFVSANEGEVIYRLGDKKIEADHLRKSISLASPYLQLVEDFTLMEMIEHAQIFKPFLKNLSAQDLLSIIELKEAKDKLIKQFSSGMKQRLKLGLAILADTQLLLLDEPVSNLDRKAIEWYKHLIGAYCKERMVIVCSNAIAEEYFFCEAELNVMDYKVSAKK